MFVQKHYVAVATEHCNFAWSCMECNRVKCVHLDIPAYSRACAHNLRLLEKSLASGDPHPLLQPLHEQLLHLRVCGGPCGRLLPAFAFRVVQVAALSGQCKRCYYARVRSAPLPAQRYVARVFGDGADVAATVAGWERYNARAAWEVEELHGSVMMLALQCAGLREPRTRWVGVNVDI